MATGAGPGGWSQQGRFPDARPSKARPAPRPRAKTNPSLARGRPRPSGECPGVGRVVVVSAQFSGLETEARRIELRRVGGQGSRGN